MRLKPAPRHRRSIGRLEITSLIDVIFLLLIFFLISARQQPPESELVPALRSDKTASAGEDLQPQIVEVVLIENEPGFRLGQNVVRTRLDLQTLLDQLPKERGVFVKASSMVTTQWAVAALQACEDAGFEKVTYVPTD